MSQPSATPDLLALKARQQAAWASGDFAVIGSTVQIVGEELCEALDLRSGSRVLDVAAGNGSASLAAARRWCEVTSTDFVPALLDRGRKRADADGFPIQFQEADAENLPFADGAFDVVISTFGVMFAPDQTKGASELLRVCRPGGKIGLANWTPESLVGQIFRIIGKYLPPVAGAQPPARWGTRERIDEFFGFSAETLQASSKVVMFRYRSAAHWMNVFRTYYGPMLKAFAALDQEHQDALAEDLTALLNGLNQSGDETLVLPSEYLEVVMVKK